MGNTTKSRLSDRIPPSKKLRVNISIGKKIHEEATKLAISREMNFSQLVCELLRREIEHDRKMARMRDGD